MSSAGAGRRKLSFIGFAPQEEEEPQLDEEMDRGVWHANTRDSEERGAGAGAGARRPSEDARHVQFTGSKRPPHPPVPALQGRTRRTSRKLSLQDPSGGWRSRSGSGGDVLGSDPRKEHGARSGLFVQLEELGWDAMEDGVRGAAEEWTATARWIKYEQDLLEGADRWGEPHVASLSFHSVLEVRRCLEAGAVSLDEEGVTDVTSLVATLARHLYQEGLSPEAVTRALMLPHRHAEDTSRSRLTRTRLDHHASMQAWREGHGRRGARASEPAAVMRRAPSDPEGAESGPCSDTQSVTSMRRRSSHGSAILRRVGAGAEAAAVLVGSVPGVRDPAACLVRLSVALPPPHFTEPPLPLRFVFVLIAAEDTPRREIGRAFATMLAEPGFQRAAYLASDRGDLLSALNEFLDDSIVLPPGDWQRADLLPVSDLRARTDAIRQRKMSVLSRRSSQLPPPSPVDPEKRSLLEAEAALRAPPHAPPIDHFSGTGRPFGGAVRELRARLPFYASDFRDALSGQVAAATVFMYFAALSSAITFGGLLSEKTSGATGVSETLVATAGGGAVFALMSAQPLMITGATGPLLLLEEALAGACRAWSVDLLGVRLYVGLWMLLIGLLVTALEGSRAVKFITRFTEDIFAMLISLIFLAEPLTNILSVYRAHPLSADYCLARNCTSTASGSHWSLLDPTLLPPQPNTALYSTVVMLATFIIAYFLRIFRNGKFLGRFVRRALGDFGVPLAIVVMSCVSVMVPVKTDLLQVPTGLRTTATRPWLVSPRDVPAWAAVAAVVPALAVYVIVFFETHIAELIVHKPERRLRKGNPVHWDALLLAGINLACSALGAPFQCVATVRSVSHVAALTVMSSNHAPGDKPHVVEVLEQRVSGLLVALLVGASVYIGPLLRHVPMPVLFGVFLYMGVSALAGIQLWHRFTLLFRPTKHHPQDAVYVRRVRTVRMHLYTLIQAVAVVLLYCVKSSRASLALPLALLLCVPLRAALGRVFLPRELHALDGGTQPEAEEDEPDFYVEAPLPS